MQLDQRFIEDTSRRLDDMVRRLDADYVQREDGEGFEVPSGEVYRLACCDCGLVHDLVFVSHDEKPIGVAARRNEQATAEFRKTRKPG